MLYNLKGTGVSTDQHRTYVEKRLRPFDKFFGKKSGARVDIELEYKKDEEKMYRAEGTLRDHGLDGDFRAEALGSTMHEAIDLMMQELHLELVRAKKRHIHDKRRGALLFKNIIRGFTGRGEEQE
jgi:ribosomal subunit interface protein